MLSIGSDCISIIKGLEENLELINLADFDLFDKLKHWFNFSCCTNFAHLHQFSHIILIERDVLPLERNIFELLNIVSQKGMIISNFFFFFISHSFKSYFRGLEFFLSVITSIHILKPLDGLFNKSDSSFKISLDLGKGKYFGQIHFVHFDNTGAEIFFDFIHSSVFLILRINLFLISDSEEQEFGDYIVEYFFYSY